MLYMMLSSWEILKLTQKLKSLDWVYKSNSIWLVGGVKLDVDIDSPCRRNAHDRR